MGWTSNPQTAVGSTAWVQVDLGAARTIDRVDLYPRNDNDNGSIGACFPQAFTIAVSANGSSWTTVTTQTNYPQPTTAAARSFAFTPTSVRYVKVNGTTLRKDSSGTYYMQFTELNALNDRPDPSAGQVLTQRDGRPASASDATYLTSYGYDAAGNLTTVTTPPVAGSPAGRSTTMAYTDGRASRPPTRASPRPGCRTGPRHLAVPFTPSGICTTAMSLRRPTLTGSPPLTPTTTSGACGPSLSSRTASRPA